jgi:toxin ParE1/3/4
MSCYTLRPRARLDLEDIGDYTLERWGEEQEEKYLRMLVRTFQALADNALMGHAFDVIMPGLFKFPAGSHIILYLITDSGVDIIRVLHHRMDIERHLAD